MIGRITGCIAFSSTAAGVRLEYRSLASMVSVVVSIRTRKMFAEVRKMFANARHAEQDVRERQASRNF
jgi:hypothetical protein